MWRWAIGGCGIRLGGSVFALRVGWRESAGWSPWHRGRYGRGEGMQSWRCGSVWPQSDAACRGGRDGEHGWCWQVESRCCSAW